MELPYDQAKLAALVRDVPDFPSPGVVFKDVAPLLADPQAFSTVIDVLVMAVGRGTVDRVIGIEARGFILAAPVADRLGAGFVPARKAGKLPGRTSSVSYELEYGLETLEVQSDAIARDDRVVIIDDVLATGGTAAAAIELVTGLGGRVTGLGFLLELGFLGGAARLTGHDHLSLLSY
jgi:adenine phosphoribosyltransferase